MDRYRLRHILCWMMVMLLPSALSAQAGTGEAPTAILHTQGGTWVNGSEARDATALFTGDLIETKVGYSANLTVQGSTVFIGPESVVKFQGDYVELSHGAVSVGTSTAFQVRINCMRVVPVLNEWTKYDVSDVTGTVHVAATKDDVNVEHGVGHNPSTATVSQDKASVHEGQENNYNETEVCGAPAGPTSPGSALNRKWLEIGAAAGGGGLLCAILCRGSGGKQPNVSQSTP